MMPFGHSRLSEKESSVTSSAASFSSGKPRLFALCPGMWKRAGLLFL